MDQYSMFEPMRMPTVKRSKKGSATSAQQIRKRTVKFLSVCRNPKTYDHVVKSAPDTVIKSICNAALNVQRNKGIKLTNAQRKVFHRHTPAISALASKAIPIARKRKIITQRGGAFWIPALIGAALGGLGPLLFGGNKS